MATVTPKKYLVTAYTLTILLALGDLHIFFFGLTQLMSRDKDPDLKITSILNLNLCLLCFTIAVAMSFTYIFKSNQLCFVCNSLTKMVENVGNMGKF